MRVPFLPVHAGAATLVAALALAGCVRRALPGGPIDPVALASPPVAAAPQGLLPFEAALRRVLEHDPELVALRAGVEGFAPGSPGSLDLTLGTDSDGRPEGSVTFDLLSVLGQGPLRAERVLARLRRDEAGRALEARAREIAREVAEAYARAAALAMPLPTPPWLEPGAFVRAGLAPAASESAVAAARRSLDAEASAQQAEQDALGLGLGVRLGLAPGERALLEVPPPGWPEVPTAEPRALLGADPEVIRRVAAYEVARGEALRALALKDPGLELSPSLALDPTHFFGAVSLRLPLGAAAEARAAHARLEAARLSVRAAVLHALAAAGAARLRWQAAERRAEAAEARLDAALGLAQAEKSRAEAEGEGFTEAVLAASAVVESLHALREARLEAARLRVEAAWAAGFAAPRLVPHGLHPGACAPQPPNALPPTTPPIPPARPRAP
jgi:hypothetical protein